MKKAVTLAVCLNKTCASYQDERETGFHLDQVVTYPLELWWCFMGQNQTQIAGVVCAHIV